jgi:hypothetical protein
MARGRYEDEMDLAHVFENTEKKERLRLGGCSLRLASINSTKILCTGSLNEMERVVALLQETGVTQGISPLEERAGDGAWHTSRFPRNKCPSFMTMCVKKVTGARSANARTTRNMNVTDLMRKV